MTKIYTPRLVLRPIYLEDAEDVFKYSCTPNVGKNAGWKPHETIDETIEIMKMIFIDQETVWGITKTEEDKIIGSIGLINDGKRENIKVKMIGYALGEDYWGHGIMTEATNAVLSFGFKELGCDLISAYCYPFNQRSENILKKCGFQYEGTLKQAEQLFNGEILDNKCYALTSKEYFNKIK